MNSRHIDQINKETAWQCMRG